MTVINVDVAASAAGLKVRLVVECDLQVHAIEAHPSPTEGPCCAVAGRAQDLVARQAAAIVSAARRQCEEVLQAAWVESLGGVDGAESPMTEAINQRLGLNEHGVLPALAAR